jgi:ElaB/YqjD/DUF883 family membrane-anchored ribosome-binding protein
MEEADIIENQTTLQKLVQDFKTVIQDAEVLAKATAGELGEKAKEARTRLDASLEVAKASLYKAEDKLMAGARATAKATDRAIREHPYPSLGLAFGLGLLIGVLVNRR